MKLHDLVRAVTRKQRPRALASYTTRRSSGRALSARTSTSVSDRAGKFPFPKVKPGRPRITEKRYSVKRLGASRDARTVVLSTASAFRAVPAGFKKLRQQRRGRQLPLAGAGRRRPAGDADVLPGDRG